MSERANRDAEEKLNFKPQRLTYKSTQVSCYIRSEMLKTISC